MASANTVRQTIIEVDVDKDLVGLVKEGVGFEYPVSVGEDDKVSVCCFADDPVPIVHRIKALFRSYDLDLPEEAIDWSTIEYEDDEDF